MRKELKVMTPSLAGGTELLVMAPIKPGFVPSLDAVTYKTRAKLLLKALHSGRKGSHEYQLFRAISDAAERVGVIHTVRVAVLEAENKVLLSVNFDGAYESYVRVIWQKAARLLDLIFCNTVQPGDGSDYPCGWDHSLEDWNTWLHSVMVETPFFYAAPGLTFQDQQGLRMVDRFERRISDDLAVTRLTVPSAERVAWDLVNTSVDPTNLAPTVGLHAQIDDSLTGQRAGIRQGLQSLVGLYRLADLYPPGTPDGLVLHRAAHELLPEFDRLQLDAGEAVDTFSSRFREQVAWLRATLEPLPLVRQPPALPTGNATVPTDLQGGIVQPYRDGADNEVNHGCLCLLAFDGPAGAAAFMARLQVTPTAPRVAADQPLVNVAFTADGLRACGLIDEQLGWFADEFRQGMASRAGVLGDVRGNHPRRWTLPLRNWPQALNPAWDPSTPAEIAARLPLDSLHQAARVALDSVHAIVQVRMIASLPPAAAGPLASTVIATTLQALFTGLAGVQPLSLQWMARVDAAGQPIDHFGFADGISQPGFDAPTSPKVFSNQIQLGEALIGFDNAADHAQDMAASQDPARRALLYGGSYLVVRKLRQHVAVMRQAVDAATLDGKTLDRNLVLAKMMGRWPKGDAKQGLPWPPVPAGDPNDFNYRNDPTGSQCPLGAHIRRANPRVLPVLNPQSPSVLASIPGGRPPRFVRRSLPYGPAAPAWGNADTSGDDADRGLVFMAYNASIAEQFEVMQRWISGGNSAGGLSGQSDPFLGVPEAGRRRCFRFEHNGATVRMALDGSDVLGDEPKPIVALQWGAYLFAPSTTGLAALRDVSAAANAASSAPAVPWSAAQGECEICRLRQLEHDAGPAAAALAWKSALEDPDAVSSFSSASVWAAIRTLHGGVLRIPYGVLVADRALVDQVLLNADQHYSVAGYQPRLEKTIGAIYLGLDDAADGEYQRQSAACNSAIQAISYTDGFDAGYQAAKQALDDFIKVATALAHGDGEARWELNLDSRELVDKTLASLCRSWFGLPGTGAHFQEGGYRWFRGGDQDNGRPLYPGHFTSPSRFTFQPDPGALVKQIALAQGGPLTAAMTAFLAASGSTVPATATVTRAVLDSTPRPSTDLAARTLVGAMMGFLPSTAGNLRRVLAEWTQEGQLMSLRATQTWSAQAIDANIQAQANPDEDAPTRRRLAALADHEVQAAMQALRGPLMRTMQARPVPELIWRTTLQPHRLGTSFDAAVSLNPGDVVILALVSATQQGLQAGDPPDVFPIFGGQRGAPATSPTHACPGYKSAMGAMAGLLFAILARSEMLRPGAAPGVLAFEGAVPPQTAPAVARQTSWQVFGPLPTAGALGTVLGWGDSWIRNRHDKTTDFADTLGKLGYNTSIFSTLGREGRTLQEMAELVPDISDDGTIYAVLRDAIVAAGPPGSSGNPPLPKALLIDGGGNDIHKAIDGNPAPLCQMLRPSAGGPPALDEAALTEFVDKKLAAYLHTVLRNLTTVTQGRIPILVHGYDHPIPDERRYAFMRKAWLYPCIHTENGYPVQPDGAAIMFKLIDRLNAMIATVVGKFSTAHNVHHVDLTGTLAAQPGYADDYKTYWRNELHPEIVGFQALAAVVHSKITAVNTPPSP